MAATASVSEARADPIAHAAPPAARMEFHPLANIFPFDERQLPDLEASLKAHGQIDSVFSFEGKILDGRAVYTVCINLGIKPRVQSYTGTAPLQFLLSRNGHRRHVTPARRAMAAARLSSLGVGSNQYTAGTSIEAASSLFDVSRTAIERGRKVLSTGIPQLATAVDNGTIALSLAAGIAELPADKQRKVLSVDPSQRRELLQLQGREAKDILAEPKSSVGHDTNRIVDDIPPNLIRLTVDEEKKLLSALDTVMLSLKTMSRPFQRKFISELKTRLAITD